MFDAYNHIFSLTERISVTKDKYVKKSCSSQVSAS